MRAAALLACLCAFGCERLAGKGGGTETESKVVAGRAVNSDGSPAAFARVSLRPADYLADLVSAEHADPGSKDTVTDSHGRFDLGALPAGEYRIEIAGAEARGSVHDFAVAGSVEGMLLPTDTLRPRGSIAGSFAPDSESNLASFVQVFGMERLVKADPRGNFILYNLPAGDYDIRLSSLQPFRREALLRGIKVETGKQTTLEPMALAKESKLAFSVDGTGLRIEGVDSTNPVIFDNERWDNGPDDEYFWAKASAGSLNLRGNIVTNDHRGATDLATQMKMGARELRQARMAGFTGLPDMTAGAASKLAWPASGNLEDAQGGRSAGSDLIVAEARKATPEKPLVVVVGGPLTTVAQAWLTDPSIAPRMVVAGVFTYNIEAEDSVANYLVARKCRFVQWGRTYTWAGAPDTSLVKTIPATRMGERTRGFLAANSAKISLGDIGPGVFLFRRSVWKGADMMKVSRAMNVQPASDFTFDFLDIPAAANDWQGYQTEYYAALSDPRAYHAFPLPGRLEAESYQLQSKVGGLWVDSTAGEEGSGYSDGGYSVHKITAAGGAMVPTARYRTGGGATLTLSDASGKTLSELALPAAPDWAEAALPALDLAAGEKMIRVTISKGSANLDWIDFKQP